MLVDGRGLLGRAFVAGADPDHEAYVFARGVADSGCTDPEAFARETALLDAALENSLELGISLMGLEALSVLGATIRCTPRSRAALIRFSAPRMLVFTASRGLYSAAGTCLRAAAWTT